MYDNDDDNFSEEDLRCGELIHFAEVLKHSQDTKLLFDYLVDQSDKNMYALIPIVQALMASLDIAEESFKKSFSEETLKELQ